MRISATALAAWWVFGSAAAARAETPESDAPAAKEIAVLPGSFADTALIRLSPDGKRLAVAGDTAVRVFDIASGKVVAELPHAANTVLAFSADGKRLATAARVRDVKVWDLDAGKPISAYGDPLDKRTVIGAAVFSPDGKVLYLCTENDGGAIVRVLDADTGKVLRDLAPPTRRNRFANIAALADGKSLVLADMYDRVPQFVSAEKWELLPGSPSANGRRHEARIDFLVVGDDGRRVISVETGELRRGGGVLVWEANKPVRPLRLDLRRIEALVGSADGTRILLTTDAPKDGNQVLLIDTATGKAVAQIRSDHGVYRPQIDLSADGRIAAVRFTDGMDASKAKVAVFEMPAK